VSYIFAKFWQSHPLETLNTGAVRKFPDFWPISGCMWETIQDRAIIIIIITMTMFMVLSSWQSHCESSPGSFDECRMTPSGRRPKTKPDDLGRESACTGCQKLHPPSPFIITQPESWYSFYRPTEGRRLSRPYDLTYDGTVIGNHNVLYRNVTFPMILSDLWRSLRWPTYCCYFVCAADAQSVSDS